MKLSNFMHITWVESTHQSTRCLVLFHFAFAFIHSHCFASSHHHSILLYTCIHQTTPTNETFHLPATAVKPSPFINQHVVLIPSNLSLSTSISPSFLLEEPTIVATMKSVNKIVLLAVHVRYRSSFPP